MRKIAIALLTTTLASNAALANKFDGGYVGVGLGYGQSTGKSEASVYNNIAPGGFYSRVSGDRAAKGVLGGLHAGWDKVWQDKWLFGLEVTGDLSSVEGKIKDTANNPQLHSKTRMKYGFGANLRAGVVMHDVLGYLSLGYSGTHWEQDIAATGAVVGKKTHKKFLNGFRAALGMGTMLNEHLMLSGEVAQTWIEKISLKNNITSPVGTNVTARSNYHPRLLEGRIKLSWKFKHMK